MSHFKLMSVTGYIVLMTRQVMCQDVSRCYPDVNICLWTNGERLTNSEAKKACQQRNNSFLARITDSTTQSKLASFRSAATTLLVNDGFWIDVTATGINHWHWIDSSHFGGWFSSRPMREEYTYQRNWSW